MFIGLDLTSSQLKPSGYAILTQNGALLELGYLERDVDVICTVKNHNPLVVAVDSPLGFPKGMCCLEESCDCTSMWDNKGRRGERILSAMGIPLYYTTKRSIIKKMVYRAIKLQSELITHCDQIIEVYPYASKIFLFGKNIPKKTTGIGLEFLYQQLNKLIPGIESYRNYLSHDIYDALVAAYTGYLYHNHKTKSLGISEEACIVVPDIA